MSEEVQSSAPVQETPVSEAAESSEEVVQEAASSEKSDEKAVEASAKEEKKAEAAAKKRIKQLKLKVDGKEYNENLPFEIDEDEKTIEYLTKQLQMAKMGQTRASEKAQLEKEVNAFIKALKENPRELLSDPNLGIDLKALAAGIIEEDIANSKKSPEQVEREKLEKELKRLQDERSKEKEEFEQREFERLQQQEFERYDVLMTQALEKADVPKTPYVIKKMADYMLLGLQNNLDLTPEDVVPLVREEMHNDLKEMFSVMPDEVLEQIVGKDEIGRAHV